MSFIINPYVLGAGGGGGPVDTFPSQSDLQLRAAAFLQTGYADLATMSQWDDLSGNARHLTQASAPERPVYHSSGGPNSQPYVSFNALSGTGGERFSVPNFLTGYTAGEIFIVCKSTLDPPVGDRGAPAGAWGTDGSNADHYPYSDGDIYYGWGTNARKSAGDPATAGLLATWHLLNIRTASASWILGVNGTQFTFSTGTNTVAFSTGARVGHHPNHGWDGAIAELAFFSVIRTGGERTDLYDYFADQYALTIV